MANVLIVEDDLTIADMLRDALEAAGFTVTDIARTFAEAVSAAGRDTPDFAVVDVNLANGDLGTDVAAHFRRIGTIGIVLSTGYDTGSIDAGCADAMMIKPYRLSDMGRGLAIIGEIKANGITSLPFPAKFTLLNPGPAEVLAGIAR